MKSVYLAACILGLIVVVVYNVQCGKLLVRTEIGKNEDAEEINKLLLTEMENNLNQMKKLELIEKSSASQNIKLSKILKWIQDNPIIQAVKPKISDVSPSDVKLKLPGSKIDDPWGCMDCILDLPKRDHIESPEIEKNHTLNNYSQRRDYPVLISKDIDRQFPASNSKLIKLQHYSILTQKLNTFDEYFEYKKLLSLFAIKSSCDQFERRNAVRTTWANSNFNDQHTVVF